MGYIVGKILDHSPRQIDGDGALISYGFSKGGPAKEKYIDRPKTSKKMHSGSCRLTGVWLGNT